MDQSMDDSARHRYLSLLSRDVFRSDTRWPQFDLLLNDIAAIAKATASGDTVLALERNLLYGGRSLFAPFFQHTNFFAADLTPDHNRKRGDYNSHLLERITAEFGESLFACEHISDTDARDVKPDLIIVPNILHHLPKPWEFFDYIADLGPETIYAFDSTLREWHQIPDDFYRMTPFAIEHLMQARGYSVSKLQTTGGPFTAILYCWEQALEFLDADPLTQLKYSDWLKRSHRAELIALEERYRSNHARPNSIFPTAFSVVLQKQSDR